MNNNSNDLVKNNLVKQQIEKTVKQKEKEFEDNLINDFNDLKNFIKLYRHEILRNGKILNYTAIGVGTLNVILYLTILFK